VEDDAMIFDIIGVIGSIASIISVVIYFVDKKRKSNR
jgi:hypothetical protein